MWVKRLIIFLIRKRLKLKKFEMFQFENQKSKDSYYWFNDYAVRKFDGYLTNSSVSLNWLLNDECKIVRIGPMEFGASLDKQLSLHATPKDK